MSMLRIRAILAASLVVASSALAAQSTTTVVSATPTTAGYGAPVSVFAVVTSSSGSSVQYPIGNVSFADGATSLGSAAITSDVFMRPATVPLTQLTGVVDLSFLSAGTTVNFVTGDVNGDGKQDVVLYTSNAFQVFLNTGAGTYSAKAVSTSGLFSPVFVDYDGDGKMDIVSLQSSNTSISNSLKVLIGDGAGGFLTPAAAPAIALPSGAIVTGAVAADFSGTGRGDLAVFYMVNSVVDCANSTPPDCASRVAIYTNSGSGVFVGHTPVVLSIATTTNYSIITGGQVADFNGDGKADLVLSSLIYHFSASGQTDYNRFDVLLGDGNGELTVSTANLLGSDSGCLLGTLAIGNFGSGKVDIIASHQDACTAGYAGPYQLRRFAGTGDGTFGSGTAVATSTSAPGAVLGVDLDGDGKLDVVSGSGFLFHGNGDGTFTTTNVTLPDTQYPVNLRFITGAVILTPSAGKYGVIFNGGGPTAAGIPVLLSSSVRTAVLPAIANLSAGTHNITATYASNGSFTASTSAPVAVTINKQTPTISGISSPSTALVTQPVTLSVKITAPNVAPTGTVTFTAGTTTLGTATLDASGYASLVYTFSTVGTQTVMAGYAGNANTASATVAITATTVNAFTMSPSSGNTTLSTSLGGSATSSIVVASQNGFSGSVAFTCSGLPTGVTCAFSPATVAVSSTASGNTTMTVAVGSTVSMLRTNSGGLMLAGIGLLCVAGVPRRRRIVNNTLLALAVSVTMIGAAGCSDSGGSSSSTTTKAAAKSYTFNITATSGAAQTTTAYTLNVQ